MKDLTVLVTGGTAPGFPSIVRAIRKGNPCARIIGTDWKENFAVQEMVDEYHHLPSNTNELFPGCLLEAAIEEEVDVIVPIRTSDLLPICLHLSNFRKSMIEPCLPVTSPVLLDMALNKFTMLGYIERIVGLTVPKYKCVETSDELIESAALLGYPKVPVCVKPLYSNGSRGFRILDKNKNMEDLFFYEKPSCVYSTVKRVIEDIGYGFCPLIVMEYLPGDEYSVDILCRKGKTFAIVPRLRLKSPYGITTSGVVDGEVLKEIKEFCEKVIESFGFSYNIGIQFKRGTDGKLKILEINPRLQGTTSLSVAAGVNIPWLMVQMAIKQFDYDYKPHIVWGTKIERVFKDCFYRSGRGTWFE